MMETGDKTRLTGLAADAASCFLTVGQKVIITFFWYLLREIRGEKARNVFPVFAAHAWKTIGGAWSWLGTSYFDTRQLSKRGQRVNDDSYSIKNLIFVSASYREKIIANFISIIYFIFIVSIFSLIISRIVCKNDEFAIFSWTYLSRNLVLIYLLIHLAPSRRCKRPFDTFFTKNIFVTEPLEYFEHNDIYFKL